MVWAGTIAAHLAVWALLRSFRLEESQALEESQVPRCAPQSDSRASDQPQGSGGVSPRGEGGARGTRWDWTSSHGHRRLLLSHGTLAILTLLGSSARPFVRVKETRPTTGGGGTASETMPAQLGRSQHKGRAENLPPQPKKRLVS